MNKKLILRLKPQNSWKFIAHFGTIAIGHMSKYPHFFLEERPNEGRPHHFSKRDYIPVELITDLRCHHLDIKSKLLSSFHANILIAITPPFEGFAYSYA